MPEPPLQLRQRPHTPDLDAVDQAGLGQVVDRHHDRRPALPLGGQHRGQHALAPVGPARRAPIRRAARSCPARPRRLPLRPTITATASAMSYTDPIFGRVAGDSANVSRVIGHSLPQLVIAARTRSRDSCSAASGSPTRCTPGSPEVMSASISTICAVQSAAPRPSTPARAPSAHARQVGESPGCAAARSARRPRRCAPATSAGPERPATAPPADAIGAPSGGSPPARRHRIRRWCAS